MKVKELTVEPKQQLSMQRHNLRAEYWIVSEGNAIVNNHVTDLWNQFRTPSSRITASSDEYSSSKSSGFVLSSTRFCFR